MRKRDKAEERGAEEPYLERLFEKIEIKCEVLCVEKDLVHKSTAHVMSSASAESQRELNFTDRVVLSVECELCGLVRTFT